ncbi:class I SAM-dependent methyltransferase [Phaeocystidibacter luteus]|uniref:EAL domain-containing protein n=1 Tax=Phaeocystidibacter luteus TaxID=911197 RepID=A0A6N6RHK5_9FLAO|nr:class I SAM-dependent methyltransferase [Phaeocystidibacter luteus]KAB2813858.1 EAL domain-containing protein [Phaeocystidibacter luteus]
MSGLFQKLKSSLKKLKGDPYRGLSTVERFEKIYHSNDWNDDESVSGPGSNMEQTQEVIRIINSVIAEYAIERIVDIPCGDFGWMNQVNLAGATYVGGDIVKDLINRNISNYGHRRDLTFEFLDLLIDPIPEADLLLVRDCLVHLSHAQVKLALDNIRRSNVKYLLTTSFVEVDKNTDIHTGDWRPLNLTLPPFNLPNPTAVYNEKCTENGGKYADKSLVLWDIAKLRT